MDGEQDTGGTMELRQIRYFLALTKTLNFTRAAEQCNVTQPTLTLAIKKLEEELGGPLIHRERSRTHLTQLGQMVLPFLEQVYESSHAAQAVAQDLARGERIPLRLGVTDAIDKSLLVNPIAEVRAAADGLELHVEGGSDRHLAARLEGGDLDIAILDLAVVSEERMRTCPLYTEDMRVLAPADDPLVGEGAIALENLVDRHWVGLVGSRVHGAFADAAGKALSQWSERHRASRPTEAQLLVQSGLGLALAGSHEPLLAGLALNPLSEPLLTRVVGLAEVRGRPSSTAALALSRLLRAQTYPETGSAPAASSSV